MTVDPHVVKLRIDKILTHLKRIEAISKISEKEYLADDMIQSATERNLQVIAQSIIDICTHLIAHNNWGVPKTYTDAVIIVSHHGVIEEELTNRLVLMVKLRNLIVHLYLDVDSKIVYESAKNVIDDAKAFIEVIMKLLNS